MTDATDPLAGIPDAVPAAPADAGGPLAEIWTNLWPWNDLNAKGVPERNLKLGPEILPVLAAMSIQSPEGPRLVQGDGLGHLVAATTQNLTDVLAADAPGGTSVLQVGNYTLFPPGSWVMLSPAPGTGSTQPSGPYWVASFVPGVLQLGMGLAVGYKKGDYITAAPMQVQVGYQPVDRPVDDARFVVGANGAVATITFPATAFQAYVLAYLDGEMIQTGANAGGAAVQVWDGLSGLGTQKWSQDLVLLGTANTIDRLNGLRRPIKCTPGNPLQITTTIPPASCNIRLSAGVWIGNLLPQGL